MSEIHPQLLADCHYLGRFEHCVILLNRNAVIPWFILVPDLEARDLLEIPANHREEIMKQAAVVAAFVKDHFSCPKINFAAIGNIVPQLHLHVVGRQPGDACWPLPVWGHLRQTQQYSPDDVNAITSELAQRFGRAVA